MVSSKFAIIGILIFLGFLLGFSVGVFEIFPYEVVKDAYIITQNDSSNNLIYEDNISSFIHINDINSKNEIKNNLIKLIWKDNNLPNYEPTKIESDITNSKYSDIKNLDVIDKFTIENEYGVNSIIYFFKPINSNDKMIIYHQGHRGDFFEGKHTIEYFLEKNYSVIAFSMPLLGMNPQPIVDTNFGKIKIQSHNQLELLENNNFNPIKFFIEPVILVVNHLENHYDFDSYHMIGISGGGWVATLAPAIDERITESYSVAGSYPLFLRSSPENFGDYEQHHLELYQTANYLDLYILSASGPDRKFVQIFNKFDSCCFDGESFSLYEQEVKNAVNNMDDGYFEIYLDDTHNEHIISNHALEIIINEING